jgi:hypothetical protein
MKRNALFFSSLCLFFIMWCLNLQAQSSSIKSLPVQRNEDQYYLERVSGTLKIKIPGSMGFEEVKESIMVPENTLIKLDGLILREALIRSQQGTEFHLTRAGIFSLPKSPLFGESWGRSVMESGREVFKEQAAKPGSSAKDRLLSFFFGYRIPPESRVSEENLTKSKLNPIEPDFPPPILVIEPISFPVSVTLHWPALSSGKSPHKVFLWSENKMNYAPYSSVYSNYATILINEYGKFFWQVEDQSAQRLSVPRTIMVRPRGVENYDARRDFDIIKPKEPTIPVLYPGQQSTIYACLEKEKVPLSVLFLHTHKNMLKYKVASKLEEHLEVFGPNPAQDDSLMEAQIWPQKYGEFELWLEGYTTNEVGAKPSLFSMPFRVHLESSCENLPFLSDSSKTKADKKTIKGFPESGTVWIY